ncbi:MAG TPA: cytochrome C [Gammaproteobacteria bacterium]|nr:cytochrome C [Gammaproteobacteria bacterium]
MGSNESIALKAYRPFYPPGILDAFIPVVDQGLPMPDVERLYLGDGVLAADQQSMPGILTPYVVNDGQNFNQYVRSLPFFTNFPFGYTSSDVNWYEAAGVPASAFDDAGRENPYPLFRVQAHDAGGSLLASVDTVAPISGEANCQGCHGAVVDGGNGAAIVDLTSVATTLDDPQLGEVPLEVSKEYAADINILRLHDQKHGTLLEGSTPVVCQSCHYTPALDLAQVGPKGPENDISAGNPSNGRDQVKNKSMSNVMHSHHATVKDVDGNLLFPSMPPPVDLAGNFRNPLLADDVLQKTCYQCHPGRRTSCLRGAMSSGGMLCQDCHGDMAQVGNDFTRNVSPASPGAFELASDFYTNPNTPRVPWANEPSCGSCHTGDAMDNMHNLAGTIGQPDDGIRLMQAWIKSDPKATPIVPTNKRFAEPVIAATGNPQLYRISTGHEGVLCESCHGATHAIFPNANPNANDNVASMQIQGHSGVISECSSCHTGDLGITLDGPHGMHPVGSAGNDFADGGHEDIAENNPDACRACHGQNGEGTVLSTMFTDRVLQCDEQTTFCPDGNSQLFPKGRQVTCSDCHDNKL